MSISDSIRWVRIFERELRSFPNFSAQELKKARSYSSVHITEVDQPVFNRIYGKFERIVIVPKLRPLYWSKFKDFLAALGWEKDEYLFKSMFNQELSKDELGDSRRLKMLQKAEANSQKHYRTADRLTIAFGRVGTAFLIFIIILAIVHWEAALALLSLFIMFAIFVGLLSFFVPAVRPALAFFFVWRAFE